MNDLISVIVPAYNAEAFIERCLNSLLRQTYENLEIICINDASTDNTAQTVKKINDPRIRLINNEQNLGISLTRNRGMEIARGKYIGFIDSDDFVDPDFYEKLHARRLQTTPKSSPPPLPSNGRTKPKSGPAVPASAPASPTS